MEFTLRRCDYILSGDRVLQGVNLVIQDGFIKSLGSEVEGDEVECRGMIVIPGLVNSHTHLGMLYLRGYLDDADLDLWLQRIWEVEREIPETLMNLSTEASIIESLMSGSTAVVDMYFNPLKAKEVAERYGIRIWAGYVFLDEVYDPFEVDKKTRSLIKEKSELFTPIVNVHSLYGAGEMSLKLAKQLNEELGLRVQIHLSETRREVYQVKSRTGKFPLEYLHSSVGLNRNWHLVHLGWVTSWEIEAIRREGATVTHCPTSNMKLATAGFFPFKEMMEAGVLVTLGTDGPASNNTLDVFREMKEAVLLQRNNYWDYSVGASHALRASTVNAYSSLGIGRGRIKEGETADLTVLRTQRLRPLNTSRVASALVFNATGADVEFTVVRGKLSFKRGKLESKIDGLYSEIEKELEKLRL